jgi:hypothetical protein
MSSHPQQHEPNSASRTAMAKLEALIYCPLEEQSKLVVGVPPHDLPHWTFAVCDLLSIPPCQSVLCAVLFVIIYCHHGCGHGG